MLIKKQKKNSNWKFDNVAYINHYKNEFFLNFIYQTDFFFKLY